MAKRKLEYDKNLIPKETVIYHISLIAYREISNAIAKMWNIPHESLQLLIIQGDKCLHNISYSDIKMRDVTLFIH